MSRLLPKRLSRYIFSSFFEVHVEFIKNKSTTEIIISELEGGALGNLTFFADYFSYFVFISCNSWAAFS